LVEDAGSRKVRSDTLWRRPKVHDAALRDIVDFARWDQDVISVDILSRVWQVESVVQDQVCVVPSETVKVPIGVRTQHNRCRLSQTQSTHPDMPLIWSKSVGDKADYLTRKALGTIKVRQGESNGISSVRDHSPVSPVPALWATVEGIIVVVLVGVNVVLSAIDVERAVLDSVGISACKVISANELCEYFTV